MDAYGGDQVEHTTEDGFLTCRGQGVLYKVHSTSSTSTDPGSNITSKCASSLLLLVRIHIV